MKFPYEDYQNNSLKVDGIWGSRTRSALSDFLYDLARANIGDATSDFFEDNFEAVVFSDPLIKGLEDGKKGPGTWKKLLEKLVSSNSRLPGANLSGKPYDQAIYALEFCLNLDTSKAKDPDADEPEAEKKKKKGKDYSGTLKRLEKST